MVPELIPGDGSCLEVFCQPIGRDGAHYVVMLEQAHECGFAVSYGVYPNLLKFPRRRLGLMRLEVVQLLGRLWGSDFFNSVPGEVKDAYKAWLMEIEKKYLRNL